MCSVVEEEDGLNLYMKKDSTFNHLLIELVQERPYLWNKSYPGTRAVRLNNWMDIQMIIREKTGKPISVQDITKRWTNLKDTFMCNKRKLASLQLSGVEVYDEPPWQYWKDLKFLLSNSSGNDNLWNLGASQSEDNLNCSEDSINGNQFNFEEFPDQTHNAGSITTRASNCPDTESQQQPSSTESTQTKKRKIKPETSPTLTGISKQLTGIRKQLVSPTDMDEVMCYANSLAPKLKRLTTYRLAFARKKIEEVLFDAEYVITEPQMQQNQNHLPSLEPLSNNNTDNSEKINTGST